MKTGYSDPNRGRGEVEFAALKPLPYGRGTEKRLWDTVTFAELEILSTRYANGLMADGFERGMHVLLMVRPGVDFVALVFALFKIGAVPVLIDPGMGVRRMLECIRQVDLQGMIAVPEAHLMRLLGRGAFRGVKRIVTVGRRLFWGGKTLKQIGQSDDSNHGTTPPSPPLVRGEAGELSSADYETASIAGTRAADVAAILFTSGSTGPAKGVVYEHGMFDAQIRALRETYDFRPGEIDLPGFPLFALFDVALGMTCVFTEMDYSRPARVDPAKIVRAVQDNQVTNTFGSPAMWRRVSAYCIDHGITLPSLNRVLMAGAPVPWRLVERVKRILRPGADVHTPYGATEALPVSSIGGEEIMSGAAQDARTGRGTCVGRPLSRVHARLISTTENAVFDWSSVQEVGPGEVGEIVVSGPVVTKEYYGQSLATERAKIRDGERIWHRMGDLGRFDEQGRLWFLGRKAHRVTTSEGPMYPIPCEAVFNEHPDVFRSALVGFGAPGRQTPVIVVEPQPGRFPRGHRTSEFRFELRQLARANELTARIEHILFHRSFPVDVRHNTKISREALATWAAKRLRGLILGDRPGRAETTR